MSNPTKIQTESIVVETETETHEDALMLREPLLPSAIEDVTPDPQNRRQITVVTTTGPASQPGRYMFKACCCSYVALDCNNIACGCKSEQDILCIRHACCLSLNGETRTCGCSTNNDTDKICNLGCLCCDVACVKPRTCMSGASQVCCLYQVSSLPCSRNYVDECVCAFCFWSCAPKCGCCLAPPKCPALNKHCTREVVQTITMDR